MRKKAHEACAVGFPSEVNTQWHRQKDDWTCLNNLMVQGAPSLKTQGSVHSWTDTAVLCSKETRTQPLPSTVHF